MKHIGIPALAFNKRLRLPIVLLAQLYIGVNDSSTSLRVLFSGVVSANTTPNRCTPIGVNIPPKAYYKPTAIY